MNVSNVHPRSELFRNPGSQNEGRFLLTLGKATCLLAIEVDARESLTVRVEQRGYPMVMLAAPVISKWRRFMILRHESSVLLERYRNRVTFCKGLKAPALSGVGSLAQNLPALPEHLGDVGVHPLHAEASLPMVGSVPASFVCERFDLHS